MAAPFANDCSYSDQCALKKEFSFALRISIHQLIYRIETFSN